MRITLKNLQIFEAAARLGSVSEAANDVAISQSAASSAIQNLERILGVPLFHRQRRKITLNENGRRLHPKARSILEMARDIEGETVDADLAGLIRIGASHSIGDFLLSRTCAAFLSQHPGVRITLSVFNSEAHIIDAVENLMIDVGFTETASMRHSLLVEPWLEDRLAIVAAPSHWAARRRIKIQDMGNENWILPPLGSATRHSFTQKHGDLVAAGRIVLETDSIEAIKGAVKCGAGTACLSRLAVQGEISRGELVEISAEDFAIPCRFTIISRRDVYHGRLNTAFLAHARVAD